MGDEEQAPLTSPSSSTRVRVVDTVIQRTKDLEAPLVNQGGTALQFTLGLLNCFFFGVGVLVAGVLNGDIADVVIGLLQMFIPVVGWIWALAWGVLMILECFSKE